MSPRLKLGTVQSDDWSVDWFRLAYIRLRSQRGQTMAEYAILIGVIALIVIVAAVFLGTSLSAIFTKASTKV
jgi:Flp pilus assembly pilin Flp